MKNRSLTILLSFVFCLIAPTVSFAARYGTVQGSIFTDTNGNNVLDRTEKGGGAAIVWLYRVLPNGAVQRVRQVYTNTSGKYTIPRVAYGNHFLAIRYLRAGGVSIRTTSFNVNASSIKRNVPFLTSATLTSNPVYAAAYTAVPNPHKLTKGPDGPTTPFSP